jgi:hypothetical protein
MSVSVYAGFGHVRIKGRGEGGVWERGRDGRVGTMAPGVEGGREKMSFVSGRGLTSGDNA